ncbi:hypothetical protein [Nocardia aurea]|uniref:Integral membrane protein n=1 Tax=Nocardia aurea TaxID=2144174 RepID=A0ABV3G1T6_9NOCA
MYRIEAKIPAREIAEVRVHGIGDHKEYSALGHPDFEGPKGGIAFGRPPILPKHTLILVNWARANRRISKSIWWYVAFPFTLANVSGFMVAEHPKDMRIWHFARRAILCLVIACGVCLSVSTAGWIVVILETVATRLYSIDSSVERIVLATSGPVILCMIIIYRWIMGQAGVNRCTNLSSVFNILILSLMAVWLVRSPPATSYDYGFARLCAATTGFVAVCCILLSGITVAGQVWFKKSERPPVLSSLAGAALLLFCAIIAVHAIGSIVRSAVDAVLGVVNRLRGVSLFVDRYNAVLLPIRARDDSVLGIDFIPLFAAAIVGTFLIVLLIDQVVTDARRDIRLIIRGREGRLIWSGKAIASIPIWLGRVVFVTLLAAIIETPILWWWLQTHDEQKLVSVVQLAGVILGLTTVFVLATRRPTTLFDIFEMIADLSGFWRVRYHPLAGTSYFPSLTEALIKKLNGMSELTIALVGHSQGSVVCASLLSETFDSVRDFGEVHLFTCGSPLQTLYSTFFPQYFNREFFSGIGDRAASWTNYWRETDPISSVIDCEDRFDGCVNIKLSEQGDRIWGHSNYWAEVAIMDRTRLMIAGQQKGQ